MELGYVDTGFDAIQHMANLLGDQDFSFDVIEAIQKKASIERRCVEQWVCMHGESQARILYDMVKHRGRYVLFTLISESIPALPELVEAISADTDLVHYWSACPEQVRQLSDEAFNELMFSLLCLRIPGERIWNYESSEQCYRILRHSTKKSEHKYAAQIARMRNFRAGKSAAPGGKLHTMASQYPEWVLSRK